MTRQLLRGCALWLGLAAALVTGSARADTKVALWQSFAGNLNFVGTQVTMRNKPNQENACSVYSSTTPLKAKLSGLPADATVVSAQLYWAGSNGKAQPDYTVTFEDKAVTAPAARQYYSATIGSGYNYFGGAADVTAQVASKGNGTYTFSGLTISNGKPYCSVEGVVGGFSLLVVYSSPSEPLRVLNLYEGFQYFRYSGITLNLSNFQVPKSLDDTVTARLAHITWEGDPTLRQNGEQLLFNNVEMTDSLNAAGNQFNSASNINNDPNSYGIDFDAYTIKPSSGLIKPGQSTATTLYQSGQDLVLLNAEIIAMPNAPTSDLSVTISRSGELQVGRSTFYTLVVRNAGPSVESGPITVTDTLSPGLNFVSAAGTGWTCSSVGQVVTCTSPGPLAVGATLPPIALTVRASAAGTYTNTATVTGKMFDNVPTNNSVSDSSKAAEAGAVSYTFTRVECTPGARVGGNTCPEFTGPVIAGANQQIFLTAVSFDASGRAIATALNGSANTVLPLHFALTCNDPGKGVVGAQIGGSKLFALPICTGAANPAWSDWISVTFLANMASAPVNFVYDDVGDVTLNVMDLKGQTAPARFVVRPTSLQFKYVLRSRDGAALPAEDKRATIGFVKGGEEFTLAVGAKTSSGNWAQSFGAELTRTMGSLIKLALPKETDRSDLETGMGEGNGFTWTDVESVIGTHFKWNRAGVLDLTPVLTDYLGTGPVAGDTGHIGLFYPDHFETATESKFVCVKNLLCPASVTGAVYSGQPFALNVTAFGLSGAIKNYAPPITLEAYDLPGGIVKNPGGASSNPLLQGAVTVNADESIRAELTYNLAARFDSSDPRLLKWTKPSPIYLRASATLDVVRDKTGAIEQNHLITSKDIAIEGGIMVVNGRLQLANAFGSELLKLPVRMNAQYWTGTAWENNIADSISAIAGDSILFSDCQKALATGSGSANCNLQLVRTAAAPGTLNDGAGTIWLAAPGRGNTGSAWLQVNDPNLPWLPSTRARAVYGIYKSPLIYIREVY